MRIVTTLALVFAWLASPLEGVASINITDDTADVVHLRQDCAGIDNCATTMTELLTWVWGTRNPTATEPLSIRIGPGEFQMPQYTCEGLDELGQDLDRGYVSFQGESREHTTLSAPFIGVQVIQCHQLAFSHLAIDAELYAIFWHGGGSSTYTDVNVRGGTGAWYDDQNSPGECSTGVHYWFGSKLVTTGFSGKSTAFRSACDETWFFGGEIAATNPNNINMTQQAAVEMRLSGQIQIFGSVVRSIAGDVVYPAPALVGSATNGIVGVSAAVGGTVHMHGGIISAVAKTGNNSVATIVKDAQSKTHIVDTAFNPTASGTGNASRIIGENADSPFVWPQSETPPPIASVTGADTFVETDCSDSGDCDFGAGNLHPHLMLYDASCTTAGPWFDSTRGKCRGEP